MAASVWKGSISFGLVSVPIKLFVAARYSHISFHEVHRECGHRVQQQLYCPYDKRVVSRDEIVMGYEIDDDKMVIVDREELKKLQPASSSSMEILQFVKLSDVDPIFLKHLIFLFRKRPGAADTRCCWRPWKR
jgi:DNA end-binding protein Ku